MKQVTIFILIFLSFTSIANEPTQGEIRLNIEFSLAQKEFLLSEEYEELSQALSPVDSSFQWINREGKIYLSSLNGKFNNIALKVSADFDKESNYSVINLLSNTGAIFYAPYFSGFFEEDVKFSASYWFLNKRIKEVIIEPNCDCFLILNDNIFEVKNKYKYIFPSSLSLSAKTKLKQEIDLFLRYYTEELGNLDSMPTVVINISNEGVFDLRGDVKKDILYIKARAQYFSDSGAEKITQLLSHEIFHLWQNKLFNETSKKWVYEGLAEAFSLKSLLDINRINKKDYITNLNQATNKCVNLTIGKNTNLLVFDTVLYHCGNLVFSSLFLLDKSNNKKRFFEIANSKTIVTEKVLMSLSKKLKNIEYSNALKQLISGNFQVEYIPTLLPSLNVNFGSDELLDLREKGRICASTFASIMQEDCGYVSFSTSQNGINIIDDKNCKNIIKGVISTFENMSYPKECPAINDLIFSKCKKSKNTSISVQYIERYSIRIPCPTEIKARSKSILLSF